MGNKEEELKNSIELTEETEVVEVDEKFIDDIFESEEVIENNSEILTQDENKEDKKENGFGSNLLASLLDQVFVVGTSLIILFIISFVIKMFGYKFVLIGNYTIFIIVNILVNLFYYPIMISSKLKNTFGKNFLKL